MAKYKIGQKLQVMVESIDKNGKARFKVIKESYATPKKPYIIYVRGIEWGVREYQMDFTRNDFSDENEYQQMFMKAAKDLLAEHNVPIDVDIVCERDLNVDEVIEFLSEYYGFEIDDVDDISLQSADCKTIIYK